MRTCKEPAKQAGRVEGDDVGAEEQHCGRQERVCRGPHVINTKQRRQIREMATWTDKPLPTDIEGMSNKEANHWLRSAWDAWMQREEL